MLAHQSKEERVEMKTGKRTNRAHNGVTRILLALMALFLLAGQAKAEVTETVTYFHTDGLGSVIAASDESGNLLWRERYRPFGNRLEKAVTTEEHALYYTGKPHDDATGLTYFGARHYDPVVGRFMGIDPVGVDPGNIHSFNRYAYANNNPYKYVDPDGRAVETAIDVISLGLSIAEYNRDPSFLNGLGVAYDGFATFVPLLPAGFGILRNTGRAGEALADATKKPPIIIGENMKRVKEYADKTGGHAYRPWKNEPFDYDLAMKRNKRWIQDQQKQGREIIDIGPDFQRRAATGRSSPFYEMERQSLKGYGNRQKVFERSGSSGGVPGLDF